MIDVYSILNGIFSKATTTITKGMYGAGAGIFNHTFFTSIFALFIVYVGVLIAFKKIQSEELAYKLTWTIFIFSLVKAFMWDSYYYESLISFLDLPRLVFTELISKIVRVASNDASIQNIINVLNSTNDSLLSAILSKAGWDNIVAYIFAIILWLTSSFLMIVILLTTVFSTFLSEIILSLAVFVIPFMIIKKTEYIFYNWCKLYISVSLYAPFTILFGLVSVETTNLTMHITKLLENDFENNFNMILVLALAQVLTALGIFKIPNIINQIIGSSNEGTSLTSGVGTVSAGATIMDGFSKATGMSFVGAGVNKGAKKMSKAAVNKTGQKWNDIKAGGRD
ncbi:hypothetical protein ABIV_1004 [Halarcobacter bivalviorum]|nr:hypothetical protein ABIV_1004 [Halarcobacter bivalviorum]